MVKLPNEIWRDFETDGVPSSGPHKPIKADIRDWFNSFQDGYNKALSAVQPPEINITIAKRFGVVGDGATPVGSSLQTLYNTFASSTAICNVVLLGDSAYYNVDQVVTKPSGKLVILRLEPGTNLGGSIASIPYDIMQSWQQASSVGKVVAQTERYWDYGFSWNAGVEDAFQRAHKRTSHQLNYVGPGTNTQSTEIANLSRGVAPDITSSLPNPDDTSFASIFSKVVRVDLLHDKDRRGNNVAHSPQALMEGGVASELPYGATHYSAYTTASNPLLTIVNGTVGYGPVQELTMRGIWYRETNKDQNIIFGQKIVNESDFDAFAGIVLANGPNGGRLFNGIFGYAGCVPSDGYFINYADLFKVDAYGEIITCGSGLQNYSPVVSASSGTITSYLGTTGGYKKIGRMTHININLQIPTNGTGSSELRVTLPSSSLVPERATAFNVVRIDGGNPRVLSGICFAGENFIRIANPDGTYPGVNGLSLLITGNFSAAY